MSMFLSWHFKISVISRPFPLHSMISLISRPRNPLANFPGCLWHVGTLWSSLLIGFNSNLIRLTLRIHMVGENICPTFAVDCSMDFLWQKPAADWDCLAKLSNKFYVRNPSVRLAFAQYSNKFYVIRPFRPPVLSRIMGQDFVADHSGSL